MILSWFSDACFCYQFRCCNHLMYFQVISKSVLLIVNMFKPPPRVLITDHPKAVVLLLSLLPVFGVRVSVTCHLMTVHIIVSSVWVAEWPPFRK